MRRWTRGEFHEMHVHYPISLKCNRVNLLRFAYVRIILHTISHLIGTLQPAKWPLVGNALTGHERPTGPNIPWNRDTEMDFTCSLIFEHHPRTIYIGKSCQWLSEIKFIQRGQKTDVHDLTKESCNRTPRPPDPFLIVHHASTLSLLPDHPPLPSTHPASSVSLGQPVKGKNPMCDSNPTPNYPFIPNTRGHSRTFQSPLNYACDGDRQLVGIIFQPIMVAKGHLIDMDPPNSHGAAGEQDSSRVGCVNQLIWHGLVSGII